MIWFSKHVSGPSEGGRISNVNTDVNESSEMILCQHLTLPASTNQTDKGDAVDLFSLCVGYCFDTTKG